MALGHTFSLLEIAFFQRTAKTPNFRFYIVANALSIPDSLRTTQILLNQTILPYCRKRVHNPKDLRTIKIRHRTSKVRLHSALFPLLLGL
jgi:hypothetical protein